jgi:hypothetical protein
MRMTMYLKPCKRKMYSGKPLAITVQQDVYETNNTKRRSNTKRHAACNARKRN